MHMISCSDLLEGNIFQTNNYCQAFSACRFWFDVQLEVQARSRADAVRVPVVRVVAMVMVIGPSSHGGGH